VALIPDTPGVYLAQAIGGLTPSQLERVELLCGALALDEQFLWLEIFCEVGAMTYAQAWEIIAKEIVPFEKEGCENDD
jgi:hypothetical protein